MFKWYFYIILFLCVSCQRLSYGSLSKEMPWWNNKVTGKDLRLIRELWKELDASCSDHSQEAYWKFLETKLTKMDLDHPSDSDIKMRNSKAFGLIVEVISAVENKP